MSLENTESEPNSEVPTLYDDGPDSSSNGPYSVFLIIGGSLRYALPSRCITIGRAANCDIPLPQYGKLSQRHAMFEVLPPTDVTTSTSMGPCPPSVYVQDLLSKNGTFIQHSITSSSSAVYAVPPKRWYRVSDSDVIKMGDVPMMVVIESSGTQQPSNSVPAHVPIALTNQGVSVMSQRVEPSAPYAPIPILPAHTSGMHADSKNEGGGDGGVDVDVSIIVVPEPCTPPPRVKPSSYEQKKLSVDNVGESKEAPTWKYVPPIRIDESLDIFGDTPAIPTFGDGEETQAPGLPPSDTQQQQQGLTTTSRRRSYASPTPLKYDTAVPLPHSSHQPTNESPIIAPTLILTHNEDDSPTPVYKTLDRSQSTKAPVSIRNSESLSEKHKQQLLQQPALLDRVPSLTTHQPQQILGSSTPSVAITTTTLQTGINESNEIEKYLGADTQIRYPTTVEVAKRILEETQQEEDVVLPPLPPPPPPPPPAHSKKLTSPSPFKRGRKMVMDDEDESGNDNDDTQPESSTLQPPVVIPNHNPPQRKVVVVSPKVSEQESSSSISAVPLVAPHTSPVNMEKPKGRSRSAAAAPTDEVSASKRTKRTKSPPTPVPPTIAVTGYSLENRVKQRLEKVCGILTGPHTSATIMVAGEPVKRTIKLLCSLLVSEHIVTKKWLDKCYETGTVVDPTLYGIANTEVESKYNFKVQETLQKSRMTRAEGISLFNNAAIYVTGSVEPQEDGNNIKDILTCGGANVVRSLKAKELFCVVCVKKDVVELRESKRGALPLQVPLVCAEWVYACVMHHELLDVRQYLVA
eukprot:PhF_6_TR36514/c0_g1_i3/m.53779